MRIFPYLLLLFTTASQAATPDLPWWPDLDEVDDDGTAGPDTDDDAAADPENIPAKVDYVDLSATATALEDGVGRVLRDGIDPTKALPVDIEAPNATIAAELRGLLTGSGARTARLDAMRVSLVLHQGDKVVGSADALLVPGKSTSILRLGAYKAGAAPGFPLLFPGGLGAGWRLAEDRLADLLRTGRCAAFPLADDATLSRLTPPAFLPAAKKSRDEAALARTNLCASAASETWDRLEIRPVELHFNLFSAEDDLRGGLRLTADHTAPRFGYPQFKNLPTATPKAP